MSSLRSRFIGKPSPHPAEKANATAEACCDETRNALRLTDAVMRVAQALWPRKTASELAFRTGSSQRACEYWLSRKTEMSADALTALLRSDAGFETLEAIMGDARPDWWKQFRRTAEISTIRKAQDDARRRIERLELDL